MDSQRERLLLSEGVVLASGRYLLRSDRLELCRTADGVVVQGDGLLRFCPCESAPLVVGFSAATLRAGDLIVNDPTLRLWSVPVFWLPRLHLRAPDRIGLLPPRVAWRGADGLLAGTGVHLPFARSDQGVEALDLRASGYLKGGVELEARLATERSSNALRWDHLEQSMLAIDAHGATSERDVWSAAYRVDALRGPRALRASNSLEMVARRFDHALVSAGHTASTAQLAMGGWALSERGAAFDERGALGPFASIAVGDALGRFASAGATLGVSSANDEALGTETRAEQRGVLHANGAAGPVGLELALYDAVHTRVRQGEAASQALSAEVGLSLEAGWPLQRDYGWALDPVQHRIEPFTRAAFGAAFGDRLVETELGERRWAALLGGVRTALGRYAARQAGSLTLQAGTLGQSATLRPAAASRAVVDSDWLGLSAEAAALVRQRPNGVSLLRARIGSQAAPHVSGYLEGRNAPAPALLRALLEDYWDAPRTGWFDRPGWSAGGRLHVPWSSWLATSVGTDFDVSREALLGMRGGLAYRHPCGCLAALGSAGKRLGRGGVDVAFTLDLMP